MAEPRPNSNGRGRGLKLCLAASGGGHFFEILDLEPLRQHYETFLITEDTAMSQSVRDTWDVETVPHLAIGQLLLRRRLAFAVAAAVSVFQSARIMIKRRPDVLITTGAGAMYFPTLWARLLGAKIILIESVARFERLSAFARIAGPLAHARILPSPTLSPFCPGATVIDPLVVLDQPRPPKKRLIFVTVGATLPFDRLVRSVANIKSRGGLDYEVVIQTGKNGFRPNGIETHETLPYSQMLEMMRTADIVVCHGGAGSMFTALAEGCRVIAAPRSFELGEHYDNHQFETTRALASRGLVSVATTEAEIEAALRRRSDAPAPVAVRDPLPLLAHVSALLEQWA